MIYPPWTGAMPIAVRFTWPWPLTCSMRIARALGTSKLKDKGQNVPFAAHHVLRVWGHALQRLKL